MLGRIRGSFRVRLGTVLRGRTLRPRGSGGGTGAQGPPRDIINGSPRELVQIWSKSNSTLPGSRNAVLKNRDRGTQSPSRSRPTGTGLQNQGRLEKKNCYSSALVGIRICAERREGKPSVQPGKSKKNHIRYLPNGSPAAFEVSTDRDTEFLRAQGLPRRFAALEPPQLKPRLGAKITR